MSSPPDNSSAGDGVGDPDQGGVGPAVGCGAGGGALGTIIGGPLGAASGIIFSLAVARFPLSPSSVSSKSPVPQKSS